MPRNSTATSDSTAQPQPDAILVYQHQVAEHTTTDLTPEECDHEHSDEPALFTPASSGNPTPVEYMAVSGRKLGYMYHCPKCGGMLTELGHHPDRVFDDQRELPSE